MGYETILYQVDDRVATITLNRPERMNALSQKSRVEIPLAIRAADQDPEVRVVVITGAGKAFCAGYDIKESAELPRRGLVEWRERLALDLEFTYSAWNCSKPVVAMINGHCLAGGLEFVQMCDLRYASDDATFSVVETRFSNGIATLAMPWLIGMRCRELIYTGDTIGAREALQLGLVNRVFARAALEAETMKIARRISRVALAALQWNKRAISHAFETMGFRAALQYGVEAASILNASDTPEYRAFEDLRRTKGLAEALRWRHEQFAPYE
jgi:enoyl-CoA hydratase/carnithine racemase